ncbi:MAG: phosphate signaling complex protein PhoU [Brevinema sp.]
MIVIQKINHTKQRILDYIKLVDHMIEQTISGALEGNWDQVKHVFDELEMQANTMQMEIAQDCLGILALYHPEASHLRGIVKMSGMASDLERMADLATKIALSTYHWKDMYSLKDYPNIIEMSEETRSMLMKLTIAFKEQNSLKAVAIIQHDDRVDELCTQTLRHLIKEMNIAEEVEPLLQIMNVAKNIERIADLCGHFAEDIVFIKEGLIPSKNKA